MKLFKIAARPQLPFSEIVNIAEVKQFIADNFMGTEAVTQAEIFVRYSGYIEKEKNNVAKLSRLENIKIPAHFDYSKLNSITIEARQKLTKIKPKTIAQASRISGVSPSDVSVLLVYMGR